MDEDYFSTFTPEAIAMHIRMSAELGPKRRLIVRVTPVSSSSPQYQIIIVWFDYLSEFSIFCGLLSAFGLDIQSGEIYSFSRSPEARAPRKIVDVFRVQSRVAEPFDDAKQRAFVQQLE